jgi:hypothetical protein
LKLHIIPLWLYIHHDYHLWHPTSVGFTPQGDNTSSNASSNRRLKSDRIRIHTPFPATVDR